MDDFLLVLYSYLFRCHLSFGGIRSSNVLTVLKLSCLFAFGLKKEKCATFFLEHELPLRKKNQQQQKKTQ